MTSTPFHVLIIGGGICGLLIAQGLQKSNIPFTLFEAEVESSKRVREWTMMLHWSLPMLRSLLPEELQAKLKQGASVDPNLDYEVFPNNTIGAYDGVSGQLMKHITNDGEFLRVSRQRLRLLCRRGIESRTKYSHTLQDITYEGDTTVTATFTNGNSYTGNLVIGADGARSQVRTLLFGPDRAMPTPLDVVQITVAFSYGNAEQALFARSAHPVNSFAVHPDVLVFLAILDATDPERPETWKFQIGISWRGSWDRDASHEEKHKIVKAKVSNIAEVKAQKSAVLVTCGYSVLTESLQPFRSAVQWIPDHVDLQASELSSWTTLPWDTHGGRAVLAGDGAHPMVPNRGQGLNNAVNDAFNLVESIKCIAKEQEKQEAVIESYAAEVVARGAKEVKLSNEAAELTYDYYNFVNSPVMTQGLAK